MRRAMGRKFVAILGALLVISGGEVCLLSVCVAGRARDAVCAGFHEACARADMPTSSRSDNGCDGCQGPCRLAVTLNASYNFV